MVAFVRKIEKNTKLKGSVKYVRFVFMFSYHGIEMSPGEHFNSEGFQMEKGGGSGREGDLLERGLLEMGLL